MNKHTQLLSPGTGWFLGQGRLYWTTDNGAHWADVTPPMSLPREKIADVQFRNAQEGAVLLSTDENTRPEAQFQVASTVDAGRNWVINTVRIPGPGMPKRPALPGGGDIFFLDSLHGWLNLVLEGSANFSPAIILVTDDGGNTWRREASPGRGSVRFISQDRGWIAGGPGGQFLYATNDSGANWRQVSLHYPGVNGSGALFSAPEFSDQKNGSFAVTLPNQAAMVLFSTSDGGISWRSGPVIRDSMIARSGVPVPSVVVDSAWLVANSEDSSIALFKAQLGNSSSTLKTGSAKIRTGPVPSPVLGLSFITPDQGWLLTDRLYTTADGGQAWKDITPWPAPQIQTVPVPISSSDSESTSAPDVYLGSTQGGSSTHTSVHMGFDTCAAPAAPTMQTWWSYSPYYDMGIYIGGTTRHCSQPNLSASWVTKVKSYGWGLIPLWAGPQAASISSDPNIAALATQQADNAATVASGLGLGGSIIYYDFESFDSTQYGSAVMTFVNAWSQELQKDGYLAGVYGSALNAGDWWGLQFPPDDVWIARADSRATIWNLAYGYTTPSEITDSEWPNNQRSHQYLINTSQGWGNMPLLIDVDIEAFTVAGGQGTKTFSNWSFTTVDWPAYSGSGGSWVTGINDAGADNTLSIGDQLAGLSNESSSVYYYTDGYFTPITCQSITWPGTPSINNLTQIPIGSAYSSPPNPIGYFYTGSTGTCTQVSISGVADTEVLGINDAGQIVGAYYDPPPNQAVPHGFVYWSSTATPVFFDYPGGCCTKLVAINGQGQILGIYNDPQKGDNGFIWNYASDGSIVSVDSGAVNTEVVGINANGQATGWSDNTRGSAFIWSNGKSSVFPADPNASSYHDCPGCTGAYGINNYGRVVGEYSQFGVNGTHGFWAVPLP